MKDRGNAVVGDDRLEEALVADVARDHRHSGRNGPIEAGREIVKYDDRFSAIEQRMHHVASDVPSAAGDQDCHVKAAERALYRCQQRSKFD